MIASSHAAAWQRRLPLLLLGLTLAFPSFAQTAPAQQPTAVIAARAELAQWSDPLDALGTLKADESVTLSAKVTETIASLEFEGGERVDAGDVLVRLDDDEARANLRAAEALRDERQAAVNRLAQLQQRNLGTRADAEDSRAQLRQAQAEVESLQAQLDNYQIKAPFSGEVGFRNISIGTLVSPGDELATLDKIDRMKLDFQVPEVALGSLTPGMSLTATSAAFPEADFQGEIATLGTRVDPVSRSVSIRALIDNPQRKLRPGMLMEVTIARRQRQALVIPEAALIPEGKRHYVLVIDASDDDRVTRRQVKVGERRPGEAEILDGLSPGDLIVSHGVERAHDGDRVRLLGIADDDTSVRELLEANRDAGDA
ncbi:efflux RND transporter periplasmic adaptor subunit [Halomonas elongata]|nr:efflux RND transporter periplasmic adaptor subunit [Halomonas elongata]MBW5798646.1 efflux RND transporter periplasmic adaptor subunit [Halomonas elongata]OBX37129.1 efflux pump periplasmic linker BepF [Halomonas elongata]WBF19164.1 efflux RND transporter periplasmic adaptor subunit [Halomonas elongata]WPU48024.1 efflux RND transporter periplasmic adaptor subunit [Halomonas elongata DSM 2581]